MLVYRWEGLVRGERFVIVFFPDGSKDERSVFDNEWGEWRDGGDRITHVRDDGAFLKINTQKEYNLPSKTLRRGCYTQPRR